jgi:hypothetical protein
VLVRFPELDKKSAAHLYARRAGNQVREFQGQSIYRPDGIHEGVFPGQRPPGLSDSRQSMAEKTAQVGKMMSDMIKNDTNSSGIKT